MGLGDSNGEISFPAAQLADLSGSLYAVVSILAALRERDASGRGQRVDISMVDALRSWLVMPLGHRLAVGKSPALKSQWWNGASPFYRVYKTKDGRALAVGALEKAFAFNLLGALGRSDLKSALSDPATPSPKMEKALEKTFRAKTLREWTRILKGKDVCVTPVLTLDEAAKGEMGTILPLQFSRSKPPARRPPPKLGQDSRAVLRSFGFSPEGIKRLLND